MKSLTTAHFFRTVAASSETLTWYTPKPIIIRELTIDAATVVTNLATIQNLSWSFSVQKGLGSSDYIALTAGDRDYSDDIVIAVMNRTVQQGTANAQIATGWSQTTRPDLVLPAQFPISFYTYQSPAGVMTTFVEWVLRYE